MKLRQETTSLGKIATVIKRQERINTDTRRLKIQTSDIGPPVAGPQHWNLSNGRGSWVQVVGVGVGVGND